MVFSLFQVLLQSSLKHKSTKKKKKSQSGKGAAAASADALSNNVEKMDIDSDAKMEVEQIAWRVLMLFSNLKEKSFCK